MNSSAASTANRALLKLSPVRPKISPLTTMEPTPIAQGAQLGSFCPSRLLATSDREAWSVAMSGHLLAAHDQLRQRVDDERDDEQAETGGDERAGSDRSGLVVLVRDVRGERDAAVLGDVDAHVV